jgi:WD40 repeat protein
MAQRFVKINRYVSQMKLAEDAYESGNVRQTRFRLSESIPRDGDEDFRDFAWYYLWNAVRDPDLPVGQHEGIAYCVRISPDGRLITTGGQDGIRLWDANTFSRLGHLTDHHNDVNGIAFSGDGSKMASAGDDHTVRIWTTHDWKVLQVLPHKGNVVAAMFVPGRDLLVTAERHYFNEHDEHPQNRIGDNVVRLWNTETWQLSETLQRHDDVIQALDVSPDGKLVASGGSDGKVCIWDLAENKILQTLFPVPFEIESAAVHCVKFANSAPWLAVATEDGCVRFWNVQEKLPVTTFVGPNIRTESLAFSLNDTIVVTAGQRTAVPLWHGAYYEGSRLQPDFSIQVPSGIWGMAFLNNHRLITAGFDGAIRAIDFHHLPSHHRFLIENGRVVDLQFTHTGQSLVTAGQGVFVYRLADGCLVRELAPRSREFCRVVVSNDGKSVAAVTIDGTVIEWNQSENSAWNRFRESKLDFAQTAWLKRNVEPLLGQSKTSNELLRYSTRNLRLEISPVPDLFADDHLINSFDSDVMAVVKAGGQLQIWRDGHRLREFDGNCGKFASGALSDDGNRLALCLHDGSIQIINTRDGKCELDFLIPFPARELAFSRDGRTLAGAFHQGAFGPNAGVRLWTVATGQQLLDLDSGCQTVRFLQFSEDGQTLMAAGQNILGT